jgi:hypothetical protein
LYLRRWPHVWLCVRSVGFVGVSAEYAHTQAVNNTMNFASLAFTLSMSTVVLSLDQWTIHWTNGNPGVQYFKGVNEADARGKYYSIDDVANAKILVYNSSVVQSNRPLHDFALAMDVGSALLEHQTLEMPRLGYYSVFSSGGNVGFNYYQYFYTTDPVDAGIAFNSMDSAQRATALVYYGVIQKNNRPYNDRGLQQAFGFFYEAFHNVGNVSSTVSTALP